MNFEERFPSLKHTGINCGLSDVENVTKELIVKHCLDKQRVREAIKTWRAICSEFHQCNLLLDHLEKELEL